MPRVPRMASFIAADYRLCSPSMADAEALRLLEQMVMMESPSFNKPLVDRFGQFVAERFAEIGGRVEVVPAERFGDHLVIRFGSGSSQPVVLLGHIDTVFSEGETTKRPFTIE